MSGTCIICRDLLPDIMNLHLWCRPIKDWVQDIKCDLIYQPILYPGVKTSIISYFQSLNLSPCHQQKTEKDKPDTVKQLQWNQWKYGQNKMSITQQISKIFEKFLHMSVV